MSQRASKRMAPHAASTPAQIWFACWFGISFFGFRCDFNHADVAGARLGEPNQLVGRSCARAAPGGGKAVGQSSGRGPVSLPFGRIVTNQVDRLKTAATKSTLVRGSKSKESLRVPPGSTAFEIIESHGLLLRGSGVRVTPGALWSQSPRLVCIA